MVTGITAPQPTAPSLLPLHTGQAETAFFLQALHSLSHKVAKNQTNLSGQAACPVMICGKSSLRLRLVTQLSEFSYDLRKASKGINSHTTTTVQPGRRLDKRRLWFQKASNPFKCMPTGKQDPEFPYADSHLKKL